MKRTPMLFSAILSLFAVTFFSGVASAAQVQVVTMVGNWRNPTYSGSCTNGGSGAQCSISNGDPTSSINWGGTVTQSGYDFSKSIPGPLTLPSSSAFPMGTFTHRNQNLSINPSQVSLRNVALDVVVSLHVDGTPVGPLTFTYTFTHDETNNTNTMAQCDPAKLNPGSTVPCPDVVTLTGSAAPTSFVVGGVNYTLTLRFVTGQNPQPLNKFITEELRTNVASLVGQFTVAQTPTVSFTANPTSIQSGQSSVLTWTTQNATQVSINQGIGIVSLNGNTTVSPSITTTYTLTATGPGGSTNATATVTVANTPRFDLVPGNISASEDAGFATFTVSRSVNITGASTVDYLTTALSATAGQDYVGVQGTLTFGPGEDTKLIDIPLIDDAIVESHELVALTISNPTHGNLGVGDGVLTIIDNDSTNPPPPPPAPFVSELVPFSVPVNFNLSFQMRVLGTGFDAVSAQVIWNNSVSLPVAARSATEITVTMNPSLWSNTAGTYPVKVRNPGPLDSNSLPFTVRPNTAGNPPPWIVQQPTANPNPVQGGTSTQLSTLGGTFSSNGSESVLNYTWTSNGPAPVSFSSNGTNAAKNATATFSKIGTYTFQVRVRDSMTNFAVDSQALSVVVNAGVGSVVVSPKAVTLMPGDPFNFSAVVRDQFGAPLSSAVTWTASAGAIASNTGSFTAPQQGSTINVTATAGTKSDTANVTLSIIGVGSNGDLSNVKVGPVPFKSTSGDPGVTFRNLPSGTTIRLFTAYGRIVQTYKVDNGGEQLWDLTNANFSQVASGVYFYSVESGGNKKEGKLVIIR